MLTRAGYQDHRVFVVSAQGHYSITPSDSVILSPTARGIYVGAAGNIRIKAADGTVADYKNVPIGTVIPVQAIQVLSSGTDAGNLVGMY